MPCLLPSGSNNYKINSWGPVAEAVAPSSARGREGVGERRGGAEEGTELGDRNFDFERRNLDFDRQNPEDRAWGKGDGGGKPT